MTMRTILLLVFSGLTLWLQAQPVLQPSRKAVEKKWIQPQKYQMTWYAMRDTLQVEMGQVFTEILTSDPTVTVVTRVSLKNVKAPWVDTTVAERGSLKPIRHASYNMQRDMVLDFGPVVTGYYADKRSKKHTDIRDTVSSLYFDSNLYPVMLGWLPLKEGYQKTISIYDYNPAARSGLLRAFVQEVKSGRYKSDRKGEREVWVVTVTDELGNGENGKSTYYFDKADRTLWQQEIEAGGRKMLMKRVE